MWLCNEIARSGINYMNMQTKNIFNSIQSMKRFLSVLVCLVLAAGTMSCSDNNDGLDYLQGSTAVWVGSQSAISMAQFGNTLDVMSGNTDVAVASADSLTLVIEGVKIGATTIYITTDQIFLQMLVRVKGFPGLWGTIVGGNNSEYDISLDLTGNNVGTASSLESTLLTEIRGALAGAELEFDADGQYARSLDGKVSEGAWQTDGDQLTLTVDNTSRVFTFKVKNTDLVELTTDLTSEVQAAYPDDGITSATLTFYVGRTILM